MTGDCSGLQPAVSVAGVEVDTLIGVTGVGYLAARGHNRAVEHKQNLRHGLGLSGTQSWELINTAQTK